MLNAGAVGVLLVGFAEGLGAAKMLAELAADLERTGVPLYIARDIDQVRDVLRSAGESEALARVCPTVQAAVDQALASPIRKE